MPAKVLCHQEYPAFNPSARTRLFKSAQEFGFYAWS